MIKKLEKHIGTIKTGNVIYDAMKPASINEMHEKINELVDAVNNIVSVQEKLIDSRFVVETKHEAPADPYAEQRRWIGKLCWFWISGKNNKNHYGKLKQIDPFSKHHYTDEDLACWDFCEPVKPDDDIIYRGE